MLIEIKQKEGESLREFITRFNAITLEVSDLDSKVTMSTMKGSLKPSRFLFSLEKRFPTCFAEMLSRAEEYTNARAHVGEKELSSQPTQKEGKEEEKEGRTSSQQPLKPS